MKERGIREFVSGEDDVTAVQPKDCLQFAEARIKAMRKRERQGKAVGLPLKLHPIQWRECADACPGEMFRVWLSADSYMIFKPDKDHPDKFTCIFTMRVAGDYSRAESATLEEIGIEMQRMIDSYLKDLLTKKANIRFGYEPT